MIWRCYDHAGTASFGLVEEGSVAPVEGSCSPTGSPPSRRGTEPSSAHSPERLEELRRAFDATMKNPEFLAAAEKA